jgi:deazaflavin-dependent oxidoreductase (nitroreductase family)
MGRTVMIVAIGAVVLGATVAVVFLIGMRTNHRLVQGAVRRFNRKVTNPRAMRTAGTSGSTTGVIRHVGRRSGRRYETPIGPFPTADGFLVALPYGPQADWVRNVLAAGRTTLVYDGRIHTVDQPHLVTTADIVAELPTSERRMLRVFDVSKCLRLRSVDEPIGPARATSDAQVLT